MNAGKQNLTQHKNPTKAPDVRSVFFQPKLTVNQPNDVYEQEADHMADQVMRMPVPFANQDSFFKPAGKPIQRKCAHCEQGEKMLHRKESSAGEVGGNSQLDNYVSSLSTTGQTLSAGSRQFFEPRFGHDFSRVRIHTDSGAAKSAQSINALAYTSGNNIVFNSGQYSPETSSGQRLMAHELTHVVQQGKDVVRRYGHDKFCDDDKHLKPFIWPGHAAALTMLSNVIQAFQSNDPRVDQLIPLLFCGDAINHKQTIKDTYITIQQKIAENYMYHCNDAGNQNSDAKKCRGQRAETDLGWFSGLHDITLCFDVINSSWTTADVGGLIIHENWHRAFGTSDHPWALRGNPPECGSGCSNSAGSLLNNPDSYACLAKLFLNG
ncbi:eCIS core domain-containing protein [Mucilaginibacter mallensis]|nr:DUF4157 domain-containing protein [Mucilaginibacter mallensis]